MVTNEKRRKTWWAAWLVFVLLALVAGGLALFYHWQRVEVRERIYRQLSAIADWKTRELAHWRRERLDDARLIMCDQPLIRSVQTFLNNPADAQRRSELVGWLRSVQRVGNYARVLLVDPQGVVRLSDNEVVPHLPANSCAMLAEVVRTCQASLSDFHCDVGEREIHLTLFAPLRLPAGGTATPCVGVVLIKIDPNEYLYPLIQSWPLPSPSAETLLVRREGDDVLFLNELRHRTNTALRLRLPLSKTNLPAALVARGVEGVVEGVDYRGVPVLSLTRRVPDAPWCMVAKVDTEEIYTPLRFRARVVALLGLLVFTVLGLSWLVWEQRQKKIFYRSQMAAAAEIHQLNTELERRVSERTAQLATANKELEAFAYSVSHDLRAPLRGIDGFSQALLEDCGPQLDRVGMSHLQRIRAASQHMGQLIDDLLRLARITRAEMKCSPTDLSALAQTLAENLNTLAPERRVAWVIAPGLTATADAHLIRVLLDNLFSNAWKFTSKHPQARIEFGATEVAGEKAPVFFVRDDGAGFDMTYADKLFGAFQRLHGMGEFPGTGIGLATCQRVVHRHGGRIWGQAAVEQGATFFFTLG